MNKNPLFTNLLIILLALSYSSNLMAQIKIIANIPFSTPDNVQIFFTGNIKECNWKADCLPMKKILSHTYMIELPRPSNGRSLEFKFTRGSFQTEAVSSHSRIPENNIISPQDSNKEFVYNIAHWRDLPPLEAKGDFQYLEVYSPELDKEKFISILLPPSYFKSRKKSFPVIYMHDGQNLFSPKRAVFSNEWSIDEVLIKQYNKGKLPEAIIIGIDNDPKERSLEYNFYDKGKDYAAFIVNTLKPYIDKNLRTKKDRENTFLMGSSYGALISFTIQWEYPQVFKKAAGLSFPAHAKDFYIEKFIQEYPLKSQDIYFYMDRGDYRIDAGYAPHTENFYQKLIDLEFPSKNLKLEIVPYADHTELDWARRVSVPLNFLLNGQ